MAWNLVASDTQKLVNIIKDLPSFGNDQDRKAILECALGYTPRAKEAVASLNLHGAPDAVATRVISRLVAFGKLEDGKESLELFLSTSVVPKVDLHVGEEIREIINRCLTIILPPPSLQPLSSPPAAFDPRTEDVKKAIRTKFDKIKDCKVLDENENRVWILNLVSDELGCGTPQPGKDMSEHLAGFLTARCVDTDLMSLVRVFRQLCKQGKEPDAGRIVEIMDLMLPLCLPRKVLSEAWQQLQDHRAVLIQTSVTKKTGAEIVVAGIHHKPAKFKKCSPEPIGEQLVPYEREPIGDPNWNVESALRELYVATFHAEVKEEGGRAIEISPDQIRKVLRGHYRARKDGEKRPCYCVMKLAVNEADRKNQSMLLSELGIPDLLFIGLASGSETSEFESYVITCLNTRFESEEKGRPV
jgi:hypothetical protein